MFSHIKTYEKLAKFCRFKKFIHLHFKSSSLVSPNTLHLFTIFFLMTGNNFVPTPLQQNKKARRSTLILINNTVQGWRDFISFDSRRLNVGLLFSAIKMQKNRAVYFK